MTRKIYIPVDISMKPFKPLREEDSKFRNPKLKPYRAGTNVVPHDSVRKKRRLLRPSRGRREKEKKISVAGAVYGRRGAKELSATKYWRNLAAATTCCRRGNLVTKRQDNWGENNTCIKRRRETDSSSRFSTRLSNLDSPLPTRISLLQRLGVEVAKIEGGWYIGRLREGGTFGPAGLDKPDRGGGSP